MKEVSKTAVYALIYALGVILNRAVSFIMLPIYTRFLTTSDYGIIELLTMTVDVFAMIAGVGLTVAVFRFYYKYESQDQRNLVISTITILLIFFYLFASSIGFLSSPLLGKLILTGTQESTLYFRLIFMTFFFQAFVEIPLMYIRAQQRPVFFIIVNTGKLILQLSLNIYFVVILQLQVLGVLYSTLIANIISGSVLILYTFKTVGVRFSFILARLMVAFGLPFILSNLGDFILTFSDRYFLKTYADLSEVGIYSLGYKLGFVLWMLAVTPIFNIWDPQRFEIVEHKNLLEIHKRVFVFFNIVLISFGLSISLFSYDLFRIMSAPAFWKAYKFVPLIILAYIIQGWTAFGNFGIMKTGKTKYIAYGTIMGVIVIIPLSFILIPPLKGYGAGLATIIAFFVRFLVIYNYSQKYYHLEIPWLKALSVLFFAVVVYCASLIIQCDQIVYSIIINLLLFLIFSLSVLISPVLDKNEKRVIIKFILHPLNTIRSREFIT
jgi:O-antigen/teichoic acid export membrane protein